MNEGDVYYDNYGDVKVICFVEKNHLVAKRKGYSPFLISRKEFLKRFTKKLVKECLWTMMGLM